MPSFLYRLRSTYERTDADENGHATSKTRHSPPPVHLTQPVDGIQQPTAPTASASRASSSAQAALFGCCYVLCFVPCLLYSAARATYRATQESCCRSSGRSTLGWLTGLFSALITLLLIIALAQDRFAHIHHHSASPAVDATLGAFRYCYPSVGTAHSMSCHNIDRHCSADGYALQTLVGYHGESVTCKRFDAFRAFFLLAFIASLSSPIALALSIVAPHWRSYVVTVSVAVAEAVCVLLSLVFFLPLLPPSSSAAPASSRLGSSFWLHFSSFVFALVVAALASYEERKRRRREWRAESGSSTDTDRVEAESIMAAAARRQGKPVTEMAATAGSAAAERLEEGAVVSGVFALGSDVEAELDLDSYEPTTSDRRLYANKAETGDDVEREYAQAAEEHEEEDDSKSGSGEQPGERAVGQQRAGLRTVGLATEQVEQKSAGAEERRTTASGKLP